VLIIIVLVVDLGMSLEV